MNSNRTLVTDEQRAHTESCRVRRIHCAVSPVIEEARRIRNSPIRVGTCRGVETKGISGTVYTCHGSARRITVRQKGRGHPCYRWIISNSLGRTGTRYRSWNTSPRVVNNYDIRNRERVCRNLMTRKQLKADTRKGGLRGNAHRRVRSKYCEEDCNLAVNSRRGGS